MSSKTILLTGATGYIGSHTWCALIDAGYRVVGLDNLSNSVITVVSRIAEITDTEPVFIKGDVRDISLLQNILEKYKIDAVIHFAAFKSLAESIRNPIAYYDNNVTGLLQLIHAMVSRKIKTLVFSSSAVVYGAVDNKPVREDCVLSSNNPYGQTKIIGEKILCDVAQSDNDWVIGCLRYFNPVGAHESGLIGEAPGGIPNNLMPYVAQVAAGHLPKLQIYGSDYQTPDGTGVRDYIHVTDLAHGHVKALSHLLQGGDSFTVNLGTGRGYSVYDVLHAYESASGRPIGFDVVGRRPGDVAVCYADVSLAEQILDWRAAKNLFEMCADSWRWQSMNPGGFS